MIQITKEVKHKLKALDSNCSEKTPSPLLILGPAYSGKSEIASTFLDGAKPAVVLGTAEAVSEEVTTRIEYLKSSRPKLWKSEDVYADLAAAVAQAIQQAEQIIIDSINQWVARLIVTASGDGQINAEAPRKQIQELVELIANTQKNRPNCKIVLVASEVGAGPAAPHAAERYYRRLCGETNQKFAQVCGSVIQVTAGISQTLKP